MTRGLYKGLPSTHISPRFFLPTLLPPQSPFSFVRNPLRSVTIPIMKFATLAALLAAPLVSLAAALPVERDVYAPPVTYPSNGTVWKPFEKHNVTW